MPWNRDTSTVRLLGLQGIMNLWFKLSNKLSHGLKRKVHELLQNICIFTSIERQYCTGYFLSSRDHMNQAIRHWQAPNATIVAWYLLYPDAALSWRVREQSAVSLELQPTTGSNELPHTLLWCFRKFWQVMIDLIRFRPCQHENLQHWNELCHSDSGVTLTMGAPLLAEILRPLVSIWLL